MALGSLWALSGTDFGAKTVLKWHQEIVFLRIFLTFWVQVLHTKSKLPKQAQQAKQSKTKQSTDKDDKLLAPNAAKQSKAKQCNAKATPVKAKQNKAQQAKQNKAKQAKQN